MLIYWRVIEWKWRLFPHGWWFQDDANIFNPSKKFCVDGIGEIDIWWYLEPPRGDKMIYLVDKTRAQQSQTWMGNCETIGIPWLWGSKSVSGWFSLKSLNFRVCCCILRLGSPVKDYPHSLKCFVPQCAQFWVGQTSSSSHSVPFYGCPNIILESFRFVPPSFFLLHCGNLPSDNFNSLLWKMAM